MATEILLYDQIWNDSALGIIQQIKAAGSDPITVRINSPGGNVWQGYAIYNALLAHVPGVTVNIDGIALSIAGYIAMAGRKIVMAENAMLMIHNPTAEIDGDASDLRARADLLDQITKSYAQAFSRKSPLYSMEQITAMMDEETWFTSEMAMLAGFVDEITPAMQMAAHFDITKFKNAPKNLMNDTTQTEVKTETTVEAPVSGAVNAGDTPAATDPTFLQKFASLLKPKAEMLAEINGLKTQVEVRDASIVELNAKIKEQDIKIKGFTKVASQMVELESQLAKMTEEAKTVEAAAIDKVAALGFPAKELPAQIDSDKKDEKTPDAKKLLEQLNAIEDPKLQTKFFVEHEKEIKAALMAAKQA